MEQARVEAAPQDGYGRLVFTFGKMPAYKVLIKSGVLVLSFDKPVNVNLEKLNVRVPEYILVARLDPDGRAIRFALSQKIKINTIKAGEKLFVDLLPANWSGLPPGLPPEVVAELARLASIAERARQRVEALKKANAKVPNLNLRIGRLPTFSRLVFEWNLPVVTSMTRRRNVISLEFDQQAKIDLSRLNADPPRFIKSAKTRLTKEGVRVDVIVDGLANVRGFREGVNYILDVTGEPEIDQPDVLVKISENQRDPLFPRVPMGSEVVHALGVPSDKSLPAKSKAVEKEISTDPEPEKKPVVGKVVQSEAPKLEPAKVVSAPVIKTGKLLGAGQAPKLSANKIPVSAEYFGVNLKLKFAFSQEVAAAIFERSGVIWAVFDSDEKLNLGGIADIMKEKVSDIELTSGSNVQIVRFKLRDRQLISTSRETTSWIMTIGDRLLKPAKPLFLKRGLRQDGYSKMTVRLSSPGHVHWVDDTDLGERLAIVTAHGPSRGMIKNQKFVEFAALKTAHGIAIRPFADDLSVRLNHDDLVITISTGLNLSSGQARQYEAGRKAISEGGRPGFLDFAEWSKLPPIQFHERLEELNIEAADEDKDKRVAARLEMARLYLGRLWGQESLGLLKLALEEDQGLRGDPVYNAMSGVAAILSGRLGVAVKNLRVHALSQDMDTKLWRGVLAVKRKNWDTAWRMFNQASTAIAKYPFHVQMEFRLAAIRAAIETGDVDAASAEFDAIPNGLKGSFIPRVALLRGRLDEALGRTQEAVDAYAVARDSGSRKINVSARYRLVDLKLRNNKLSPAEAIDELESLSFRWRGDETELRVLHLLGQLYRDGKQYRRAFETMKMAVKVFSSNSESRLIQSEMEGLFKNLFLRGKADTMEPIKALSLFYDYLPLTPPGRLGDDMIRKLADRLVSVDLLAQAEEILEHQVSSRLGGAAKAEVAAHLAYIYLLDRKPELALRAIRLSRQTVMAKSIIRQRGVLEARALAELGNVGQAMDLLGAMKGDDVERLKAEALWTGRNWQSAGEQIERLLIPAWKKNDALTDDERLDVLRSGVSFALAEDQLGLDRLREKFIEKMGSSPDAGAFSLITKSVDTKGMAFNDLARKIASLDTLNGFLDSYRKRFGSKNTPKS